MGITTTTDYGRQKIAWPDFAHEGGTALHGKIVAGIAELSNSQDAVWTGEQTLANGDSYNFVHNFGMALSELTVVIYVSGAFVQEGSSATWTITQVSVNEIAIQNNTGGSATFFAYVLGFNLEKVIGDASSTAAGIVSTGAQTFGGAKTFAGGAVISAGQSLSADTIGETTAAAGVTIDGVLLKDAAVNVDTINEKTSAAGVTIDGALIKDGGAVFSANLATDAVRITQTGAGNALVVEDDTNPDATPFAISSTGQVVVGAQPSTTTASSHPLRVLGGSGLGLELARFSANTTPPGLSFAKSRSGTIGTNSIVLSGDQLFDIAGFAANGTTYDAVTGISSFVDGTAAAGDIPTRLSFWTTPAGSVTRTERMRIDKDGVTMVNATSPVTIGAYGTSFLQVRGSGSPSGITAATSIDGAGSSPIIHLAKSRGTSGSPTVTSSGDTLGVITFAGYDGNSWEAAAAIHGTTDGAASDGDMPGRLRFFTCADGTTTLSERMRIDSAGLVSIYNGLILARNTKQIVSDAITPTEPYHPLSPESGLTDTLNTINGGTVGQILVLRSATAGNTITIGTAGNLKLAGGASFAMSDVLDTIMLICDGTNWLELSRSNNA